MASGLDPRCPRDGTPLDGDEPCEACGWPEQGRWRNGRKVGRTLYLDGKLVGMVDTTELAEEIVRRMNG